MAIQAWSPTTTLGELFLKKVPFWIQVHGLPLLNMTSKSAIAIWKGLGKLVKIEENSEAEKTFRSFLRLLVNIDVSKPLNLGFSFTHFDGSATWIRLKYERLDVYCTDCGRIGHKQYLCLAQQVDIIPSMYLVSLKVNVFSNLQSSSPNPQLVEIHQPSSYPFINKLSHHS
jgi:hypothetical protein